MLPNTPSKELLTACEGMTAEQGQYLDQGVYVVSSQVQAVEVEVGQHWQAGQQLHQSVSCHTIALAHTQ